MEQTIVKMTDAYLKGLKPGRHRTVRDEQCPNLLVFVTKRAVTYKFKGERRDQSSTKGWKTQSATLGPVDQYPVATARAWAYGLLARIQEGDNPNRKPVPPEADTRPVSTLWQAYAQDLVSRGKDPYNHHHYGKSLERDPKLWAKPVRELTREDVKALHASITHVGLKGSPSPYSANRTRECLSAALNFAIDERWGITENVARASKRLRNKERKRNEAVPFELLPYFWAELQHVSPVRAAFHSLVLLLGLRLKTAKELRWEWIDLDSASLLVPAESMKMENEWWCPLSRKAVAILGALPRVAPYVFAVRTRDRSRWTHIAEEKEDGPLKPYVGGKLRTTYRTAHDKARSTHAIAEYLHGHVVKGISAHYRDLTQMRDEMRAAQEAVSSILDSTRKSG